MIVYHDTTMLYVGSAEAQYKEILEWMSERYIIVKAEKDVNHTPEEDDIVGYTFVLSEKTMKEFFEKFKLEKFFEENHPEDGKISKWASPGTYEKDPFFVI